MANKIEQLFNKLEKNLSIYKNAIGELEAFIFDKVEMADFSIFEQSVDGLVIEYNGYNAPLDTCLEIIKEKGFLSIEDYLSNTF